MTKSKEKANQNSNKRYNLKNDVIFKTFFSRKGNEEFLIDFLNALLKIEIKSIQIREEVNLEKLAESEKGGRLDLQAKLNDGIIINIELQIENQNNMENRTLLYGAKTISREVQRGTNYKDIKQLIMINILDYEMLGFDEYISETVTVLDKHREYEIIKGEKWYFIELPKFRKAHPDMNEKINQWLAFIDDYDKGVIEMAEKKNKMLEKARIEMNYLTGDEEVRRIAELREKWEMDWNSGIADAKEEGREEGIKENQIETAKKLIKLGMSMEEIKEVTNLSEEKIESLKENK